MRALGANTGFLHTTRRLQINKKDNLSLIQMNGWMIGIDNETSAREVMQSIDQ
jgi:hypothetical protein